MKNFALYKSQPTSKANRNAEHNDTQAKKKKHFLQRHSRSNKRKQQQKCARL